MRVLSRNKQTIYYQNYLGEEEIVNDGVRTGKHTEMYTEKTPLRVHISWGTFSPVSSGNRTYFTPYGVDNNYTFSMYLDQTYGFDETTLLWVGDTDKPNYIVSSVRPNKSGVVISAKAIKK